MDDRATAPAGAEGPVQRRIADRLADAFDPLDLQVINESRMHSVPPGSETHFKVLVVSPGFQGQSLIDRHRRVHAALAAELAGGVHALSISAHTPEEWEAKGGRLPESPVCRGGSKHG